MQQVPPHGILLKSGTMRRLKGKQVQDLYEPVTVYALSIFICRKTTGSLGYERSREGLQTDAKAKSGDLPAVKVHDRHGKLTVSEMICILCRSVC